jgi:hypothetical protein
VWMMPRDLFGWIRVVETTFTGVPDDTQVVSENPDRIGLIVSCGENNVAALSTRGPGDTNRGIRIGSNFAAGGWKWLELWHPQAASLVGSAWWVASGTPGVLSVIEVILDRDPCQGKGKQDAR